MGPSTGRGEESVLGSELPADCPRGAQGLGLCLLLTISEALLLLFTVFLP